MSRKGRERSGDEWVVVRARVLDGIVEGYKFEKLPNHPNLMLAEWSN